jgi:hyperosmotically inducible protein
MNTYKLGFTTLLLATLLGLAACQEKGPAEKAGENIDNAVESMGDKIEDATDNAGDALEEAGDKIEDKTD